MARLIDADALFESGLSTLVDGEGERYVSVNDVVRLIRLAPTVEAVPVDWLREKVIQAWRNEQEAAK